MSLSTSPDFAGGDNSNGRIAWITGASQGIGRALALELASRGWQVAASARGVEALQQLAEESVLAGRGRIIPMPLDVCDSDACQQVVEQITATQGAIDLAVLNAGTHQPLTAAEFTVTAVRQLIELNLMGCVNSISPLLTNMQARGAGRIAVVASLSGYRGLPTASAYGASKAALINLCESLRLDLHGSGVSIQVINPGFVKTPLTDRNTFSMPELISAEQAALYIVEGVSSNRFEIRFPPRFAWLMGLLRHLPYSLYFPLIRRMTRG